MLRGFWLAIAVLAVIVQSVSAQLSFDSRALPGWLFAFACGAAALYAVGAAVTLFSAEREERTSQFLSQLPVRWQPMFAAKVVLALASAAALAAVLCLSGYAIGGGVWPSQANTVDGLLIGGVAVVEATVWGLLFSLWLRQPLLAAIVAIGAASLGAQLAVAATPQSNATFTVDAYALAVPRRLLLGLGVFGVDLWLAARWLGRSADGARQKTWWKAIGLGTSHAAQSKMATGTKSIARSTSRFSRRRMMSRLLWQTLRESWTTMLVAGPVAILLMAAISLPLCAFDGASAGDGKQAVLLWILFLPALWGALVFRSDGRAVHRDFFAAHAGRPRYMWLARQLVWLAALFALCVLLHVGSWWMVGSLLHDSAQRVLQSHGNIWYSDFSYQSPWTQLSHLNDATSTTWHVTVSAWCAFFTAYSIGQLCSLVLRREILAGFLALLFSIVLVAWTALMLTWQLSAWWSILPIGIGAMCATWLRAPDWIVGRMTVRSWLKPLAAAVVPIGCILVALPAARLAQLDMPQPEYGYLLEPLKMSVGALEESRPAALETALAYERLYFDLVPWEEATKNVVIEGQRRDDLDFLKSEAGMGYGAAGADFGMGGYGFQPVTPEQEQLLYRFSVAESHAWAEANQSVLDSVAKLSRRPHAEIPAAAVPGTLHPMGVMYHFEGLLVLDAARLVKAGDLKKSLERYLSVLRLRGHRFARQSTESWVDMLDRHGLGDDVAMAILAWAQHPEQTSVRITAAIEQIEAAFGAWPDPREAILIDWEHVRDILRGDRTPTFLSEENPRTLAYLPYVLNLLPWERERALAALDGLTRHSLNYIDAATWVVEGGSFDRRYTQGFEPDLRDLIRFAPWRGAYPANELTCDNNWEQFAVTRSIESRYHTSALASQEFAALGQGRDFADRIVSAETQRRGLVLQLALLAYRLDQGEYPDTLAALTPDYFGTVPLDPYSGEWFVYRPGGFEAPVAHHRSSPRGTIKPGTPVFWSVGSMNFTPNEMLDDRNGIDPQDESDTNNDLARMPVVRFIATEPGRAFSGNLIFALPK